MERRSLLKSAGCGLLGASGAVAAAPAPRNPRPTTHPHTRPRGKRVTTRDGTEIFVRDWGTGPAVLFLAGWALPSDFWAQQMVPLCDAGARCIAYDRRGHGASDDPGQGYHYDQLADDLADVIDAVHAGQPLVLVAHSMSGGEVVRYLKKYGSRRVAGIVFVGTVLPALGRSASNPKGLSPEQFESYRQGVILADFPKWLQDNARPFFVAGTSQDTMDWVKSLMLRSSMKSVIDCHRAQTNADFHDELDAIDRPVLLIHGERDVSAPLELTAKVMARRMPKATLKVYADAPHGLPITHAKLLNSDILDFVQQLTHAFS